MVREHEPGAEPEQQPAAAPAPAAPAAVPALLSNETFAGLALEGEAELAIQAGEWRFSATHAEGARARGVDTERTIWFTAAARVDGQEVPCDGAGAKVVVDHALTLELAIQRGVQR